MEQRYYPRIRTALFSADGGLDHLSQYIRVGVMLPTPKEPMPKIYLNSVLRNREEMGEPEESLSIRLGTSHNIKTGFVGFVLAIRERNKVVRENEEFISKEQLIRIIEGAWQGYFDAQVHKYGGSEIR